MCLKHRNSTTGGVLGMTDPASAGYRPQRRRGQKLSGIRSPAARQPRGPSHSTASGLLRHDFHAGFLVYFTFPACQNEAEWVMVLQNPDKA